MSFLSSALFLLGAALLAAAVVLIAAHASGCSRRESVRRGANAAWVGLALAAAVELAGVVTAFRYGWGAVTAIVVGFFAWLTFAQAGEPPRLAILFGAAVAAVVFAAFYVGG